MKKYRKIIVIIATIILVAAAGYAFYANKQKEIKQEKETKQEELSINEKGDNPPQTNESPQPTTPSSEKTVASSSLPVFTEISLTVYLNQDPSTGPDGKTQIPVGALMPYFYTSSGNFTIQKKVVNEWKDLLTNVSYAGHGGLWAFYTEPSEDNIEYRVLKIESGKPVSVSKTFIVKRSDLITGTYTYN